MSTAQRLAAEALGTAFLLAAIVGSGIMGERLAGGNEALALLANSLATGCALIAILVSVGPVSGAHLNPLVSLLMAIRGELAPRLLAGYVGAQLAGAVAGVLAAHAMFGLPLLELATKPRPGASLVWSEFVATGGLLAIVVLGAHRRPNFTPFTVAAYITAAYWFTASTSFANPAVTLARMLTDTFTGIAPDNVAGFMAGQLGAAVLVAGSCRRGSRRLN